MAKLDDAELVDVIAAATLIEEAVTACRSAALDELYARQVRTTVDTRPTPPRALERSPRRRGRRRRKRRTHR